MTMTMTFLPVIAFIQPPGLQRIYSIVNTAVAALELQVYRYNSNKSGYEKKEERHHLVPIRQKLKTLRFLTRLTVRQTTDDISH